MSHYYFAYGSNMDKKQMADTCPNSKFLAVAYLKNHKLDFTRFSKKWNGGVADIVESEGDTVYGLLFIVSDVDIASLDKREGHPYAYRRTYVDINTNENERIKAETYAVVTKVFNEYKPSEKYLKQIIDAATVFGLPKEYINSISVI